MGAWFGGSTPFCLVAWLNHFRGRHPTTRQVRGSSRRDVAMLAQGHGFHRFRIAFWQWFQSSSCWRFITCFYRCLPTSNYERGLMISKRWATDQIGWGKGYLSSGLLDRLGSLSMKTTTTQTPSRFFVFQVRRSVYSNTHRPIGTV